MKKTLFFVIVFIISLRAYSQNTISGTISDEKDKSALIGASVAIKGTIAGAIADVNGKFSLKTKQSLPLILKISAIGYASQEITVSDDKTLSILLKEDVGTLAEVTITGNRVEQGITKSPVTVEKLDISKFIETEDLSENDKLLLQLLRRLQPAEISKFVNCGDARSPLRLTVATKTMQHLARKSHHIAVW